MTSQSNMSVISRRVTPKCREARRVRYRQIAHVDRHDQRTACRALGPRLPSILIAGRSVLGHKHILANPPPLPYLSQSAVTDGHVTATSSGTGRPTDPCLRNLHGGRFFTEPRPVFTLILGNRLRRMDRAVRAPCKYPRDRSRDQRARHLGRDIN